MKSFFGVLAGLLLAFVVACGGGATSFERGELVSGTVKSSDTNVEGKRSVPYVTEIFEGIEYFIRLTSETGEPVGIWSADASGFIVEVDADVPARTVSHVFSAGDAQEFFVQSPDSDVPAPFTFEFWIRGS